MQDDRRHEAEAEHPDEPALGKDRVQDVGLQPVRVMVERLGAHERLEVAVHVHEQESDHDQAGHRHDDLLDDR
ncbi:hypothetical protein [Tessaracoccus coleopterorum]|uniref:hypothetical protein n=1 Tax=Tessaracoccus coleopterorum TaxID=2714950 RepID=UPI001E4E9F93|nr:hypothetical protein [Tessaracoccus coleopterorum]